MKVNNVNKASDQIIFFEVAQCQKNFSTIIEKTRNSSTGPQND